jgi:hypothetical protein
MHEPIDAVIAANTASENVSRFASREIVSRRPHETANISEAMLQT